MSLSPQSAAATIQFLSRVQLAPSEIPAFMQISNELNMIANPPAAPVESPVDPDVATDPAVD